MKSKKLTKKQISIIRNILNNEDNLPVNFFDDFYNYLDKK